MHVPRGERFNALTHVAGAVATLGGLLLLVVPPLLHGEIKKVIGFAVYGVTLFLAYVASTAYHSVRGAARDLYRRYDRMAIYLLIAGTYTPFTLVTLRGSWGWTLLALVWGLAILGIALEVVGHTRRVSVALHLAMGWLGVIAAEPMVRSLHPDGLLLLVLGGAAYTLGVVFYAWRRLPYNHAVWHLFVMAGSLCHFACVFGYVIPAAA